MWYNSILINIRPDISKKRAMELHKHRLEKIRDLLKNNKSLTFNLKKKIDLVLTKSRKIHGQI